MILPHNNKARREAISDAVATLSRHGVNASHLGGRVWVLTDRKTGKSHTVGTSQMVEAARNTARQAKESADG